MARRVVRHLHWQRSTFSGTCSREQFADIAHARAQIHRSLVPLRIVLEQVTVLFHDRTTAGGVDSDELRAGALEGDDILSRQCASGIEVTGMRVERTATFLAWCVNHRVAIDA